MNKKMRKQKGEVNRQSVCIKYKKIIDIFNKKLEPIIDQLLAVNKIKETSEDFLIKNQSIISIKVQKILKEEMTQQDLKEGINGY